MKRKNKVKFKISDLLVVLTGDDKGKTGKLSRILLKKDKFFVKIEGLNLVKRAYKKTHNAPGKFIMKESFIDISNVKHFEK